MTTLSPADVAAIVGVDDPAAVKDRCHEVSLAVVRSGAVGTPGPRGARVARGGAHGIASQHSWIAIGDPYDPDATVLDPTRWTHLSAGEPDIIEATTLSAGTHSPHGYNPTVTTIFAWGRPPSAADTGQQPITLTPPISDTAALFLDLCGPLGWTGWHHLLNHAPPGGWPAAEILTAAAHTPALAAVTQIDRLGMLTDLNPEGLYW